MTRGLVGFCNFIYIKNAFFETGIAVYIINQIYINACFITAVFFQDNCVDSLIHFSGSIIPLSINCSKNSRIRNGINSKNKTEHKRQEGSIR